MGALRLCMETVRSWGYGVTLAISCPFWRHFSCRDLRFKNLKDLWSFRFVCFVFGEFFVFVPRMVSKVHQLGVCWSVAAEVFFGSGFRAATGHSRDFLRDCLGVFWMQCSAGPGEEDGICESESPAKQGSFAALQDLTSLQEMGLLPTLIWRINESASRIPPSFL